MKPKSIVFLSFNIALAIVGFIFAFTNMFLEKTEIKYSVTFSQSLFDFEPNVWVILTIITLFCMIATVTAILVIYTLMKVLKKKVLWNWYFASGILLCSLVVAFVIFAINVCVSNSVFGFGLSTDYKFNVACYVFIILISIVGVLNVYNALDTNKKLLK